MTTALTQPVFASHLNTKFRVLRDGQESVEIELVEVGEFLQSEHQERFSIMFRGPGDTFFKQGMYDFDHHAMGKFRLFIVPVDQKDDGYYYEAVFNRLVK